MKVYDPVLCMMVEKKATRTTDAASVSDYARYLWKWEAGQDLPSELVNSFVREAPFEAKPENRDKAYAWASKQAMKELDAFYSKLTSEVNSLLKKGYAANKARIQGLGR